MEPVIQTGCLDAPPDQGLQTRGREGTCQPLTDGLFSPSARQRDGKAFGCAFHKRGCIQPNNHVAKRSRLARCRLRIEGFRLLPEESETLAQRRVRQHPAFLHVEAWQSGLLRATYDRLIGSHLRRKHPIRSFESNRLLQICKRARVYTEPPRLRND